jgi:TonB family protein
MPLSDRFAPPTEARRLLVCLGASVLLHLAVVGLGPHLLRPHRSAVLPVPRRPMVQAAALTPAAQAAVRQARRQRQAPRKPPAQPPQPIPSGQVVELDPLSPRLPPKAAEAAYLAERNSRVDRQTRARSAAPDQAPPQQAADRPRVQQLASLEAMPQRTDGGGAAGDGVRPQPTSRRARPLHSARPVRPEGSGRLPSDRPIPRPAAAAPSQPLLSMAQLLPSVGSLARASGGAAPDALPEVEDGEATLLNAREFKFASFFNRIKRAVASHWRPQSLLQLRDPAGTLYGNRPRSTTVQVVLGAQGKLLRIDVDQGSGLDFLDQAAIEAFERAAPFANPPAALCDEAGQLSFRFGFYLDFHGQGLR